MQNNLRKILHLASLTSKDRFYLRDGTQNTQYEQCVVIFQNQINNSFSAMIILFTQSRFFLRNGSFTVLESKLSFYAMTQLEILTTFILRNEARSHAYDISNLNLSCITSYVLCQSIKKLALPGSNLTECKKTFFSSSELEKSSFSSQSLYLDQSFSFLHVLKVF